MTPNRSMNLFRAIIRFVLPPTNQPVAKSTNSLLPSTEHLKSRFGLVTSLACLTCSVHFCCRQLLARSLNTTANLRFVIYINRNVFAAVSLTTEWDCGFLAIVGVTRAGSRRSAEAWEGVTGWGHARARAVAGFMEVFCVHEAGRKCCQSLIWCLFLMK